jgi:hypothetical protein
MESLQQQLKNLEARVSQLEVKPEPTQFPELYSNAAMLREQAKFAYGEIGKNLLEAELNRPAIKAEDITKAIGKPTQPPASDPFAQHHVWDVDRWVSKRVAIPISEAQQQAAPQPVSFEVSGRKCTERVDLGKYVTSVVQGPCSIYPQGHQPIKPRRITPEQLRPLTWDGPVTAPLSETDKAYYERFASRINEFFGAK